MLTTSQKAAKKQFIKKWWKTKDKYNEPFLIGGAAGTGKTFWVNHIIEELGIPRYKILVVAYTGQAVSVLRRRGTNAFTVYSKFMELEFVDKVDDKGNKILRDGIPYKIPRWKPVEKLDYKYDLIIVEEASFINEDLAKIINSYGIPVLYIGDHVQLQPVTGIPYFTDGRFDAILEEPMRQLEGSRLLEYLTRLRRMEKIDITKLHGRGLYFIKSNSIERAFYTYTKMIKEVEMVICSTNKHRSTITNLYREKFYDTDNPIPVKGERMICRRNRWNYKLQGYPLVNGTIGYNLHDIAAYDIDRKKGIYHMDFRPKYIKDDYFDHMVCDLDFLQMPFGDKDMPPYRIHNFMEYGTCITAHLSQGDQYKDVLFIPSWHNDPLYKRKLDYTAASRAEKELYVLLV